MNLGDILKGTDNMTRMVDLLSVDPAKKAYLEAIDSYINLSRSIFCRRKTVDQHIDYLQDKHAQNMRDTHYVIQPKQIEKLMQNMIDTLENEDLLNKVKNLNTDVNAQLDLMEEAKKERDAMIDVEYEELKANLIAEYKTKCKQMQSETDKEIEEMKQKYKNMNECVPSLTIEQLQSSNPFKAAFYVQETQNESHNDDNKSSP